MPWQSASVQIALSAPEVGIASLLGEGPPCVCWKENLAPFTQTICDVLKRTTLVLIFQWCLWLYSSQPILCIPRETNPKVHPLSAGPDTTRLEWMSRLGHRGSERQPGAGIYLSFLFCPREMQDGTRTTCTQQKFKHHVCISSYESVCTSLWTHFTSSLMSTWCLWT